MIARYRLSRHATHFSLALLTCLFVLANPTTAQQPADGRGPGEVADKTNSAPSTLLSNSEIDAIAGSIPSETFGPKGDTFGTAIEQAIGRDPVANNGVAATGVNVHYGDHPRNVFDFWQASGDQPSPLVIFIHGGGFRRGDKALLYDSSTLVKLLDAGISVAGINYRFAHQSADGTVGSLHDVARAVQYFRFHAAKYNIDPSRIGCYGGSAGGAASLWLAFHDDLADPDHEDPILRESTRLTCAAGMAAPATLDLVKWESILGISHEQMVSAAKSFGVKDEAELYSPALQQRRKVTDLVELMSADDPPVFIHNSESGEVPSHVGHMAHHPNHARVLKQRAEKVGIEAVVFAPQIDITDPSGLNVVTFVTRHLIERPRIPQQP